MRGAHMHTRRDFGKAVLAAVPMGMAFAAKINSTVNGVRLGTITYSFRDFPRTPGTDNVDAIIQALTDCGIGEIELFSANVESASATAGRGGAGGAARQPGAPGGAPPDRQAAAAAMRARMNSTEAVKAREDLRQWRLSTPVDHFKEIRKKFDNAGINIYAYTMNYRDDFTDDELEKTFEQAKGLGTDVIATSTQLPMTKRL